MTAIVYRNPRNPDSDIGISWIGTNNNGKTQAGTMSSDSSGRRTIATLYYFDVVEELLLPFGRLGQPFKGGSVRVNYGAFE
jgi:hypothetical protein